MERLPANGLAAGKRWQHVNDRAIMQWLTLVDGLTVHEKRCHLQYGD
jgi:hypothetical protein